MATVMFRCPTTGYRVQEWFSDDASEDGEIEPFARQLAEKGRTPEGGRAILKHVGKRVARSASGLRARRSCGKAGCAVWDRPDLCRGSDAHPITVISW
jgi:hypothetical protein